MIEALDRSNVAIAKYLVDKGADVNEVDKDQNTALHKACEISKSIVEFLIEKGANMNVKDYNEDSPMHNAAEHGSRSICSFLYEKKCHLNIVNNSRVYFITLCNETPLHKACYSEKLNIVKYLITNGAEIDISDIHLNV